MCLLPNNIRQRSSLHRQCPDIPRASIIGVISPKKGLSRQHTPTLNEISPANECSADVTSGRGFSYPGKSSPQQFATQRTYASPALAFGRLISLFMLINRPIHTQQYSTFLPTLLQHKELHCTTLRAAQSTTEKQQFEQANSARNRKDKLCLCQSIALANLYKGCLSLRNLLAMS